MVVHASVVFTLVLYACVYMVVECDLPCINMMQCTIYNIQQVGRKVDGMQSNMAAIVNQLSQMRGALNTSDLGNELQKQNMTFVSKTEDFEQRINVLQEDNTQLRKDLNNGTEDLEHRVKTVEGGNEDSVEKLKVLKEGNIELRNDLNNNIQEQNTTFVSKTEDIEQRIGALQKENTDVRKDLDNEIQKQNTTFVSFRAFPNETREYSAISVILQFDSVAVNIGQHYNAENSTFVCPYDAYYIFMVSLQSTEIRAYLMLDGSPIHRAFIGSNGIEVQVTVVAVTLCEAGQRVWVETVGWGNKQYTLHNSQKSSSFSGSLLRAV